MEASSRDSRRSATSASARTFGFRRPGTLRTCTWADLRPAPFRTMQPDARRLRARQASCSRHSSAFNSSSWARDIESTPKITSSTQHLHHPNADSAALHHLLADADLRHEAVIIHPQCISQTVTPGLERRQHVVIVTPAPIRRHKLQGQQHRPHRSPRTLIPAAHKARCPVVACHGATLRPVQALVRIQLRRRPGQRHVEDLALSRSTTALRSDAGTAASSSCPFCRLSRSHSSRHSRRIRQASRSAACIERAAASCAPLLHALTTHATSPSPNAKATIRKETAKQDAASTGCPVAINDRIWTALLVTLIG